MVRCKFSEVSSCKILKLFLLIARSYLEVLTPTMNSHPGIMQTSCHVTCSCHICKVRNQIQLKGSKENACATHTHIYTHAQEHQIKSDMTFRHRKYRPALPHVVQRDTTGVVGLMPKMNASESAQERERERESACEGERERERKRD